MEPHEGGRRTRILKARPDRKKRHYKSRSWENGEFIKDKYPLNGGNVTQSAARKQIKINNIQNDD